MRDDGDPRLTREQSLIRAMSRLMWDAAATRRSVIPVPVTTAAPYYIAPPPARAASRAAAADATTTTRRIVAEDYDDIDFPAEEDLPSPHALFNVANTRERQVLQRLIQRVQSTAPSGLVGGCDYCDSEDDF